MIYPPTDNFCPFCFNPMHYNGEYVDTFGCTICNIQQRITEAGTRLWIDFSIKGNNYSVCMDTVEQETRITEWEMTADGFTIGRVILTLPFMSNLTPANVADKIKLFMVFL